MEILRSYMDKDRDTEFLIRVMMSKHDLINSQFIDSTQLLIYETMPNNMTRNPIYQKRIDNSLIVKHFFFMNEKYNHSMLVNSNLIMTSTINPFYRLV